MKVKIIADSTADLTKELCEKYNIEQINLTITLGETSYIDNETINPEMIYQFVKETKKLPKTSAINQLKYQEVYQKAFDEGYEGIVHFTISSEMSTCYNNAVLASKEFENVYPIDSKTLSTGIALLAIYAAELAQKGELSAKEIAEKVEKRIPTDQTSFVLDKLEYLYRGGRCNAVALLGANLLRIKPLIQVKNAKMGMDGKFFGKMDKVVMQYIEKTLQRYNNPDYTRIFITHTKIDQAIVNNVIEYIKNNTKFKEVLETTAGSTITSHCGPDTLGILYLNDGEQK